MKTVYRLRIVNDHFLVDDRQKMIIDTGSPSSMHSSCEIDFGGETYSVERSLPALSNLYLSQKVGCEIHGLLGMDIIKQHSVFIDLSQNLLVVNDDNDEPMIKLHCLKIAGGLPGIVVKINKRKANVIVDTGATISYIDNSFIGNAEYEEERQDFSPYLGSFTTKIYTCSTDLLVGEKPYNQKFGIPPQQLSEALSRLGVDGIIGVDLFKHFRIQIKNGELYIDNYQKTE